MPNDRPRRLVIAAGVAALPVISGGVLVAESVRNARLGDEIGGGGLAMRGAVAPAENPITEEKRVLGKILFWDEQLSSDNTMACGTCHIPSASGSDPVLARHPGPDGAPDSPDDIFGSFGVVRSDLEDRYSPDEVFDLDRQVTVRSAQTMHMSAFGTDLFWDGRAPGEFRDPETGDVIIPFGGGLESQVLAPPLSDVEMAHEERDWGQIADKLGRARPLGLATDVPPDMADAIAARGTYPELFEHAFGDPEINAVRIAMAIATYERTLVPDQTPWDAFVAGDQSAMTERQIDGWNFFQASNCAVCHQPPLFTDNSFRNIGVRPTSEDLGRFEVTGVADDRGSFKVPTLRNIGLKRSFMHTGQFQLLNTVFNFYLGPGAPGNNNRDPLLPVPVLGAQRTAMIDFLIGGLTDPRVASEQFPFDRPTLRIEAGVDNPAIVAGGAPGQGGFTPRMIADVPPNLGNSGFKIGLDQALGGAPARVRLSETAPVGGELVGGVTRGAQTASGPGAGAGFATFHYPLPANPFIEGRTIYMQWRVDDASAPGGVALSPVAEITLECPGGCPEACPADLAEPFGELDFADVARFLVAFAGSEVIADHASPAGVYDFSDVAAFLGSFGAGCP